MDEPLSSELIARYLAAESSAEERKAVEAWAASSPTNAAELDRLRAAWGAKGPKREWNTDAAWTKVATKLESGCGARRTDSASEPATLGAATAKRSKESATGIRRVMLIAAAVLLMVGAGYGWIEFGPGSNEPSLVVTTKIGERRSADLADGTHVMLGPLSELRVAGKYNRSERRVDLTGQAWFEVKHDADHPFRVHAFGTITEDVGTSFSVRALPSDSVVRVIVADGSVAVRLERGVAAEAAALKAHDLIDLDARTLKAHVVRNVVVEPMISWRTGHVEFSDSPFADVAIELQRWYGLVVRLDRPAIGLRQITYSMPTDSLAEALTVLRTSLVVTFERKGDTIFVH